MKNKKIFIIPLLLFCCGWKTDYLLDVNNNDFKETIVVSFDENIYDKIDEYKKDPEGDFFETSMVYSDIFAIEEKSYKREIVSAAKSTVTLSYTYTFDGLNDANYINKCFDNFYTEETNNYYYIKVYGKFNCSEYNLDEVKIKTNKEVKVNDSAKYNGDGSYTWKITDDNLNNIEIKIYKKVQIYDYLYVSAGLLLLIILLIFVKKSNRANRI